MSPCVSVVPHTCRVSVSACFLRACVYYDLSWSSGPGSEPRPLAQKATNRTRIVLSPLSPHPLPTAAVALLPHLHGTYLPSKRTLGPGKTGHQERPASRASEPVRPLEQPKQVTSSWDFPAVVLPRPPSSTLSPTLHPTPHFHFQKCSHPLPIPEAISPTFDSWQPRTQAEIQGPGEGGWKGQHSGAVPEGDISGDHSACQLLLQSELGQREQAPASRGDTQATAPEPGGPLPPAQRCQHQACLLSSF